MERGFNNNLILNEGPHIYSNDSVRRRMFLMFIALLPQLVASTAVFGKRVLLITIVSVLCSMVFELLVDLSRKNIPKLDDFTFAITGIIIAFGLPVNIKLWLVVVADAIAIIIVKGAVHGKGRNIINPAATALLVIYAFFDDFLELWPAPLVGSPNVPADATIIPSSFEIMHGAEGVMPTNWELFLGFCPGPLGMVSIICLLAGGIFLVWRKVTSWVIPVSVLATSAFIIAVTGRDVITMMCSGGIVFIAFFMATDPVTSPIKGNAQALYGVSIGLVMTVFLIGTNASYGGYIAIIVMNIFSIALDRFFAFERYKGLKKK